MITRAAYKAQAAALLPHGWAWEDSPGLNVVLSATAGSLAEVNARADMLLEETDPRTVRELLAEWEEFAGLPDPCVNNPPTTLEERRLALWFKLTMTGGQSLGFFQDWLSRLGYVAEIIPHGKPFIAGIGRCGQRLGGPPSERLIWRIIVKGSRGVRFRSAASRAGEPLLKISRASDLECAIRRYSPAHTLLIFSYEE